MPSWLDTLYITTLQDLRKLKRIQIIYFFNITVASFFILKPRKCQSIYLKINRDSIFKSVYVGKFLARVRQKIFQCFRPDPALVSSSLKPFITHKNVNTHNNLNY